MDLAAAKLIISDPTKTFTDKYKATIAIVNDEAVEPNDLLDCLDIEGGVAELAVMKLYSLTGRARDDKPLRAQLARSYWESFLVHHYPPDRIRNATTDEDNDEGRR